MTSDLAAYDQMRASVREWLVAMAEFAATSQLPDWLLAATLAEELAARYPHQDVATFAAILAVRIIRPSAVKDLPPP